eukprot:1196413-Prorocentrum_minimum.AAC.4
MRTLGHLRTNDMRDSQARLTVAVAETGAFAPSCEHARPRSPAPARPPQLAPWLAVKIVGLEGPPIVESICWDEYMYPRQGMPNTFCFFNTATHIFDVVWTSNDNSEGAASKVTVRIPEE